MDRPWRTGSSGSTTSSYATARNHCSSSQVEDTIDFEATSRTNNASEVTTPTRNRWAQYETEDLEEESRRATSNAVVNMATRMANEMPASPAALSQGSDEDDKLAGFLRMYQ